MLQALSENAIVEASLDIYALDFLYNEDDSRRIDSAPEAAKEQVRRDIIDKTKTSKKVPPGKKRRGREEEDGK